jgi:hypothetical protein
MITSKWFSSPSVISRPDRSLMAALFHRAVHRLVILAVFADENRPFADLRVTL